MESFNRIAPDVRLGRDVKIFGFVNLYGCRIGDETRIGCFVEIQNNVTVGARCKISSHAFICEGVEIEDEVFIGHHVCFTNDRLPRACRADGTPKADDDWELLPTRVRRRASIGSGALVLPGVTETLTCRDANAVEVDRTGIARALAEFVFFFAGGNSRQVPEHADAISSVTTQLSRGERERPPYSLGMAVLDSPNSDAIWMTLRGNSPD